MKPIPHGTQHITDEDIAAVTEALKSPLLTQGPKLAEFERAFADYVGARYAVAVSNGTAALHLSALAAGLGPGDRAITTPITFAASANCIRYCGAEAVFADIDPQTYLLDANRVETLLQQAEPGTYKALIPVDLAGYPVDAERFRRLADRYGLRIIEDACHAPGAWFTDSSGKRQRTGNGAYADMTVFSFHPVKHIACGEGGMVTTDSEELYEKLLLYRTHGITKNPEQLERHPGGWYYEMQELGYNYRLTEFQAALGLSQLKRADAGLARRQEIARVYDEGLKDCPGLTLPSRAKDIYHAFHLYVIQCDNRKGLYDHLHASGIFAQVHYIPVHLQPYYRSFGWKPGDLPVAEGYYERCLSLPMYPTLTDEEQRYVIDRVKAFYR